MASLGGVKDDLNEKTSCKIDTWIKLSYACAPYKPIQSDQVDFIKEKIVFSSNVREESWFCWQMH